MHTQRSFLWLPTLLISFLLLALLSWAARAQPTPSNVTLSYFEAVALNDSARLRWGTDTELSAAGFFLERAVMGGSFVRLQEIGVIPAVGDPIAGADYEVIDQTAVNGNTYTYKLFEIETNGDEIELAQAAVTLSGPTATPVPIGGGTTNTPMPPAPQNTPTATATAVSGGVPTVTPTPAPSSLPTSTPGAGNRPAEPSPQASPTAAGEFPASPVQPTATPPRTVIGSGTAVGDVAASSANAAGTDRQEGTLTTAIDPLALPPVPAIPSTSGLQFATGIAALQAQEDEPFPTESYVSPLNTPIPIGSDRQNQAVLAPAPASIGQSAAANQGRLMLWGGFLLAMLIFGGSIIGSIILFTRKQTR